MIIGTGRRMRKTGVSAMLALAGLMAAAGPAHAGAERLFYERSLMLAADGRCSLFQPPVRAALNASAVQARGAALRAGAGEATLSQTAARAARRAASAACDSGDLALAADRVREGFAGWVRTARMSFPGEAAHWQADRTAYSSPTWRLSQTARYRSAQVIFGQAEGPAEAGLYAVVSFPGRSRPYAARLVLRDPARAQRPWLTQGGLTGGGVIQAGLAPLPPATVQRVFWAASSRAAPATLLPEGRRQGEMWLFPDAAADAVSQLDPRERFSVEFLFRDDTAVRVHLEVGDFAAARAFLALGSL